VNNGLEGAWKEIVKALLEVQNWHLIGGTGENHTKVRTSPNESQTRYTFSQILGFLCVAVLRIRLYSEQSGDETMLRSKCTEHGLQVTFCCMAFLPDVNRVTIKMTASKRVRLHVKCPLLSDFNPNLNILTHFFNGATAPSGEGPPHYRGFAITLKTHHTRRTPLDEWSARRRDLYLTTHNNHKRQISCPRRDSNPQSQQANGGRPTP
jgi:hypothetical protein